jgi:periplasmic protein CpxP/Spy
MFLHSAEKLSQRAEGILQPVGDPSSPHRRTDMRFKYRWLAFGLIPLAAIATIGTAFARGGGWRRDPEKIKKFIEYRVNDVLEDAQVDEKKRKEILGIVNGVANDASPVFMGHREVREEFMQEWESTTPDKARLHQLIDERAKQMTELAHKALDAGLQVHGKLTPAQRAEILEEIRGFHGGPH